MSASVGPNPKTDAVKGAAGASPGMATGGPALVMGAGAGPWAVMGDEGVAGVDLGVVAGVKKGLVGWVEGVECWLDDGTKLEGGL